jgi:GT2 family glycosyltransferase
MRDGDDEITRLTAVSPEGYRADLLGRAFRHRRTDIEQLYGLTADVQASSKPGFVSYLELPGPSLLSSGWKFELRSADGVGVEADGPPVIQDPGRVRQAILSDLVLETFPREDLLPNHAHPALRRLQERHRDGVKVDDVEQYGSPPARPEVSIVVPLYRRIDFVEHQLAQFVHDPEIGRSDLIYVLDSPELSGHLRHVARQLARLYGVPFRVVMLNRNGGFALANNLGVSQARGRRLVLMNSDVLPTRPGWLGVMSRFADRTPRLGALAPKLLFEDDSLQHAGMYFHRPNGDRLWENMHYFKGLHRYLPEACVARRVPAITGACLLTDRELYEQIGGLRGAFVQGDYEDSDFCLRLDEAGYECWYVPDAELYHLEGQSYPPPLRQLTVRYNTWLHTCLWDERIAAVMARASGS